MDIRSQWPQCIQEGDAVLRADAFPVHQGGHGLEGRVFPPEWFLPGEDGLGEQILPGGHGRGRMIIRPYGRFAGPRLIWFEVDSARTHQYYSYNNPHKGAVS